MPDSAVAADSVDTDANEIVERNEQNDSSVSWKCHRLAFA